MLILLVPKLVNTIVKSLSYTLISIIAVMEKLFVVLKTGSVEEVKKVIKETNISPTICDKV